MQGSLAIQFKIVFFFFFFSFLALVKPKNQSGWGFTGSSMAEMKHNLAIYSVDTWAAKRSSSTRCSQPRHLLVPEAAIRALHITANSPLLQSASCK